MSERKLRGDVKPPDDAKAAELTRAALQKVLQIENLIGDRSNAGRIKKILSEVKKVGHEPVSDSVDDLIAYLGLPDDEYDDERVRIELNSLKENLGKKIGFLQDVSRED